MTARQKMLLDIEEIQRKVTTGEIIGIALVAHTTDRYVLSRCCGEPLPPHGVLILQELAEEARRIFLDDNYHLDDGRPRLRAAEDDEERATDSCPDDGTSAS